MDNLLPEYTLSEVYSQLVTMCENAGINVLYGQLEYDELLAQITPDGDIIMSQKGYGGKVEPALVLADELAHILAESTASNTGPFDEYCASLATNLVELARLTVENKRNQLT